MRQFAPVPPAALRTGRASRGALRSSRQGFQALDLLKVGKVEERADQAAPRSCRRNLGAIAGFVIRSGCETPMHAVALDPDDTECRGKRCHFLVSDVNDTACASSICRWWASFKTSPSQSGNRTSLCLFRCLADHIFIVGLWVRVGIVADFIWVHRHYINRVHELDQVFRQPGRT